MTDVAEPNRDGFPPRFVLGRAAEGVIWRFRNDLETELMRGIARLAAREKGFPIGEAGRPSPPERLVSIERLLADACGDSVEARHEWIVVDGARIAELWLLG